MDRVFGFVAECYSSGIEEVSVYLLSTENLARTLEELSPVVAAEAEFVHRVAGGVGTRSDVAIRMIGSEQAAPEDLRQAIRAEGLSFNQPATQDERRLNLLLAYNPFAELLATGGADIDGLWVSTPLDMVIRTSGEQRLSNFLPLQSGYAELAFVEKSIAEFSVSDLHGVLELYKRRKRRLGK